MKSSNTTFYRLMYNNTYLVANNICKKKYRSYKFFRIKVLVTDFFYKNRNTT